MEYKNFLNEIDIEVKAYVFGKALVTNIDQIKESLARGFGTNPAKPLNEFSHTNKLADSSNHFVSVNNDILYSNVQVDISGGPIVLIIPKIKNRYYVFQFVDAWTNNFAYIGRRSLGEKGGKFLLVPLGYNKAINKEHKNHTLIECPTHIFSIVGRIECSGEEDVLKVIDIQNELKIKNLRDSILMGLPHVEIYDYERLLFWNKFRTYYKEFPSPPSYRPLFKEIENLIGINNNYNNLAYFAQMSEVQKKRLINGEKTGQEFIQQQLEKSSNTNNGWQVKFHEFDYNSDYFGFGTVNEKKWVNSSDNTESSLIRSTIRRSTAAIGGLWVNQAYEAVYSPAYVDITGEKLNGRNKYQIHFENLPPVDAFWSITMYDAENYFLVDNEINRYSIGDRTKNINYNEDGSLTILISSEKPSDTSNWLPSPMGEFRPILRAYLPKDAILDGKYTFPGIVKIG